MTPALRTARCLTAAAAASSATATYLVLAHTYWPAIAVTYVAGLLAWCADRDYRHHRRILTAHERARRAARLEVQLYTPCCHLAEHSDGQAHNPSCQRPVGPDEELAAACCVDGFVFRGATHAPTCPTRTTRSNAA